ncbi:MAG: hypothetical protein DME33_06560 [Verrucomicrobia bacterium]|nr:MAG: hypothetical protein DME33_06560 [Verrucomicrobiota bacterium]
MRRSKSEKRPSLASDLKRLAALAYRRLENSKDLVEKFHRLPRTKHPDSDHLQKLYEWLFVPITLWPVDIEGLFRVGLYRALAGRRLDNTMILLINLLPPLPSNRTQRAVSEHEHSVQYGNYEPLIRARHKYDNVERLLAEDPAFQAQWNAIKAHFDVKKFTDHKGIIRRRLVTERSMRDYWPVRWTKTADRFHAIFDVFCQRWHLYGMRGDRPLLLKLTANLTPFGTMIFIPAYWSFDPKRDLNWRAITALNKARGVPKQGSKLSANQSAARSEAIRATQVRKEADALKLKGEARTLWMLQKLNRDLRTDERQLRRILTRARDGV